MSRSRPPSPTDATAALRDLDTAAVSDACDRLGLDGTVVTGIAPQTGPARIVGRAITVRLGPPAPGEQSDRHLGAAAVDSATAGDVLVIDHQGRLDCAGWGGLLSRGALRRGCAGTLVDGAARDLDEARDIGYPVFAAGATPRTARGRAVERTWGEPITFGGVPVSPGDLVFADGSGIVVVPSAHVSEVIRVAEAIASRERAMSEELAQGAAVGQVMGRSYETLVAPDGAHDPEVTNSATT